MSPPHYEHPSDFNDTNASFNTGTQMMSQSQPDKAIGLGLLDCQPTPIVTSGSSLRPAFVTDWGYNERAISVSPRLKTEVDDQWVFAGAGGQHLQAPWQTSTTFPTPTDYTSASSLLSPATSRMSHSARTSISSVYASHSLTTCESFDPMLASQTHIAPHLAWSAPGGEDVIAYPGMHDLSMLAASPATSAPDDLSTVFFPMPSSTAGLVPSTLTLATDQMCMESNAGSRYSTEDLEDETVMLVDMPVKKANRKLTTKANAKCSCEHCGMLFQRSHNLKMHMKTHDRQRKKEHKCPYAGCDKEFDRKADYVRHEDAVCSIYSCLTE